MRAPWSSRSADLAASGLIRASAYGVLLLLALIFIFIGKEALPVLQGGDEVSLSRLFLAQQIEPDEPPRHVWQPVSDTPKYSLIPLLIGTVKVTLVALFMAIPLGLGAAIYTSEFAPGWIREWIKPAIEVLAGIPSVVIGFFALMVMATWFKEFFGTVYRLNALVAGAALGLAVIPIVFTVAEDALNAVPRSYRDGSLAMGASTWQTAWRVVLPGAFPGIFAACILGLGRAVGETMIVLMASGNAAVTSWDPTRGLRSLSATVAAEMGEVVHGSPHFHLLFFIGALLFVLTFVLNLIAHWWTARLRRRLGGGDDA